MEDSWTTLNKIAPMNWISKRPTLQVWNHAEEATFMTLPTEKHKDRLLYLNCFPKSEPGYVNLTASQKTGTQLKILGKLKCNLALY